jgi:hypothetical protein
MNANNGGLMRMVSKGTNWSTLKYQEEFQEIGSFIFSRLEVAG